jgi:hypothetical protein
MTETYRGWTISYDPPPIPIRDFDWRATGPNYDASYEGPEDGWVDNGEKAEARTRELLLIEIDNWFEENALARIETGAAETVKQDSVPKG